ncbi:MAG: EAL domain-containing protein [Alphaproteobacteria bacterium]|nr:EAL domain-containing protein [Alphaproteobacteria bacterium]
MSSNAFEAAARSAGALALSIDVEGREIRLDGAIERFGLETAQWSLEEFAARLGPADRARFERALGGAQIDLRIRLIGKHGGLIYARMLASRTEAGLVQGLMTPAGPSIHPADRIEDEQALAAAVEAGEVCAFYQPVVSLSDRSLAGFEALARWQKPDVGVLAPADFLGLAEDIDLLGRISTIVRDHAIADLSAWRLALPTAGDLFVAANASVSELVSETFQTELLERVSEAQLPAGRFKLEIAETEIMRDADAAQSAMDRLAQAGVALALDDFGTGYSSLARLDRLPFDVVKIDQYFVRAMAGNESAATVVRSVIQLAAHYGMKTVAEGVETEDSAIALAEMGCDFAQGYRFSGALPPDEALTAAEHGFAGRFRPAALGVPA